MGFEEKFYKLCIKCVLLSVEQLSKAGQYFADKILVINGYPAGSDPIRLITDRLRKELEIVAAKDLPNKEYYNKYVSDHRNDVEKMRPEFILNEQDGVMVDKYNKTCQDLDDNGLVSIDDDIISEKISDLKEVVDKLSGIEQSSPYIDNVISNLEDIVINYKTPKPVIVNKKIKKSSATKTKKNTDKSKKAKK